MEIKIENKHYSSDCSTYADAIIPESITLINFIEAVKEYDTWVDIHVSKDFYSSSNIWLSFTEGKESPNRVPKWADPVIKRTEDLSLLQKEQIVPTKIHINYGWGQTRFDIYM